MATKAGTTRAMEGKNGHRHRGVKVAIFFNFCFNFFACS
jgi:hypothetical protein